jgi:hypothetical protein
MEGVTAFLEGPGCFLIVWALCARKAWRYSAVVLVSLGQLYGDVLYFLTCLHGGEACSRGRARQTGAARATRGLQRSWGAWKTGARALAIRAPAFRRLQQPGGPRRGAPRLPTPASQPPSTPPARPSPGVDRHTRPEFIYFWFYFVVMNGIWIVIPTMCLVWAIKRINAAVAG